jgi:hypothetical protein
MPRVLPKDFTSSMRAKVSRSLEVSGVLRGGGSAQALRTKIMDAAVSRRRQSVRVKVTVKRYVPSSNY